MMLPVWDRAKKRAAEGWSLTSGPAFMPTSMRPVEVVSSRRSRRVKVPVMECVPPRMTVLRFEEDSYSSLSAHGVGCGRGRASGIP